MPRRICSSDTGGIGLHSTAMKTLIVSLGVVSALGLGIAASAAVQQRPDFTGGWTATKEAPEGMAAAPSPVFSPRFWLDQKGETLTVTRPRLDGSMSITHKIGGGEVRTMLTGAACFGDSGTITSVAWEGNNIVHRVHGTIVPGGSIAPAAVRQVIRKLGPDRLQVESVMRQAGQTEPVPVATVYTRMTDAPPVSPAAASINVKTAPATLPRMSWLGGTWVGTQGTSSIEERWTPASGGSMFAISRTVSASGGVSAFEYLCIAERAGSLVYTAMPNGRTPATDFMLTAIDDTSATFENPAHDFPKVIRYALQADGTLNAIISGAPGSRATTFTFKKQ